MLELGVRVREAVQGRGGRERDRGTRVLIALTIGGAVGPYAYTGLLLITTGFGLAIGNWFALAVGLLLPLPGILWRIRVEEAELERVLGPPTARTGPGPRGSSRGSGEVGRATRRRRCAAGDRAAA